MDVAVGAVGVDFDGEGLRGGKAVGAEGDPDFFREDGFLLIHGDGGGAVGVADGESGVARAVFVGRGGEADFVAAIGGDGEREGGRGRRRGRKCSRGPRGRGWCRWSTSR